MNSGHSLVVALYVEVANCGRKLNGGFVLCYTTSEYLYYLYRFHDSLPANEANFTNFTVGHQSVETDTILSPNTERITYVDLRLVTCSQAEEATKKATKNAFESVKHLVSSSEEIDKSQPLVQIDGLMMSGEMPTSGEVPTSGELSMSVEMPSPMSLPDIATSHVMWSRLYHAAVGMGYDVIENKSSIAKVGDCHYNPQASKYYLSRPDIVLYKPKKLCAYINVVDVDDESQSMQTLIVLRGANKLKLLDDSSKVMGQLLAEMEKVAGDLASMYLKDAAVPDEKKDFQYTRNYWICYRFWKVYLQGTQAGNGFS